MCVVAPEFLRDSECGGFGLREDIAGATSSKYIARCGQLQSRSWPRHGGCPVDVSGVYEYDEENCVVKLKNSPVTLDETILLCEHLASNSQISDDANFLIDLRSTPRLFQFDEIYQLVAWHKAHDFPFKGRFAFVVDRPATVGTANIFCSLLQLQSVEAEMFEAQNLAMEWLARAPRTSGAYLRGRAHEGDDIAEYEPKSAVGR